MIGKFARLAVKTAGIDYNGGCAWSAGRRQQDGVWLDRAANPWSDIPLAKAVMLTARIWAVLSDPHRFVWRAG
jgi:assimilatory nitrate reductase catalytic subunit